MSVNITVSVPLAAVVAIKDRHLDSTMGAAAISATSRAVVTAVLALPYDIKSLTVTDQDSPEETMDSGKGAKSAAFALAQSHLDDSTFTITVMHRAEHKPAAVIRVLGSTTAAQLAEGIEEVTEMGKHSLYLVYDHKPFYDGKRGTYDEDVTMDELGISDENAKVQVVYQL